MIESVFTGWCKWRINYRSKISNLEDFLFTCPSSANIPNGDLSKGESLAEYLPPFPPKGIGFQRFVFILYRQTKKLDFDLKLKPEDYANLEKRTFSTLDFYRQYQDEITPAGLAFFQTDYDKSLTSFYHNVLGMMSNKVDVVVSCDFLLSCFPSPLRYERADLWVRLPWDLPDRPEILPFKKAFQFVYG